MATSATTGSPVYRLLVDIGVSRALASDLQDAVGRALLVLLVLLVAALLSHLGAGAARRATRSLESRAARLPGAGRAGQRIGTLGHIATSLWRAAVWVVAGITVLGEVGVNLTPFLAGATVIGAAMAFGAQSLVRDLLSGFLIVAEDQYGVGDTITVGTLTGVVEDLSLRVTRVRALDGKVWWLANGDIRTVANSSVDWARALVELSLPRPGDLRAALDAAASEARAFAAEARWAPLCLDAPEVWGPEAPDGAGVLLRVAIRTRPQDQPRVQRALGERLISRLVADGLLPSG